jgi:hypothetical protein
VGGGGGAPSDKETEVIAAEVTMPYYIQISSLLPSTNSVNRLSMVVYYDCKNDSNFSFANTRSTGITKNVFVLHTHKHTVNIYYIHIIQT